MTEITHIGQLAPDRRNARKHNPRNIGMIVSALNDVGAARSIVIDEDGAILAGNGTIDAAAQAGIERVRVVDADGEEIIAVRRSGLSAEQKTRLALYDNRTAELATWDAETLAELAGEIDTSSMFSADELATLLRGVKAEPAADPGAQVDRAEELRAKWQTERGQLWQVGRHRLLCGDATNADDVARLMAAETVNLVWTDPPYGVAYQTKLSTEEAAARHRRRDGMEVENDDLSPEQTEGLIAAALGTFCGHSVDGASCYVASPAGTLLPHFISAFDSSGFRFKHSLVWVKDVFVMGRADYHYRHELILYGWKSGAHYFVPDRTLDSVFDIPRPRVSEEHPTMKPVDLVAQMIVNSSKPAAIVADPFVGSGTTIVAAQQEGRTCYAMDIDPKYVAVSLERLAGMGLEPRLA